MKSIKLSIQHVTNKEVITKVLVAPIGKRYEELNRILEVLNIGFYNPIELYDTITDEHIANLISCPDELDDWLYEEMK